MSTVYPGKLRTPELVTFKLFVDGQHVGDYPDVESLKAGIRWEFNHGVYEDRLGVQVVEQVCPSPIEVCIPVDVLELLGVFDTCLSEQ